MLYLIIVIFKEFRCFNVNAIFSNNVQFIDVSEINFEDATFMNTEISSKYKNLFGENREGIEYKNPDYSPKDYSDQDLSGKKLNKIRWC